MANQQKNPRKIGVIIASIVGILLLLSFIVPVGSHGCNDPCPSNDPEGLCMAVICEGVEYQNIWGITIWKDNG